MTHRLTETELAEIEGRAERADVGQAIMDLPLAPSDGSCYVNSDYRIGNRDARHADLRYEVPGRDDGWCTWFANIRASTQLDWGDDAIEAMQLGMAWLTSLDDKSKEANKITAGWIREFLAPPPLA